MSLKRTGTRKEAAENKKKVETHELKGAYILPAESGERMIHVLGELPIKYSQLIGPMIDALQKAFRGDITVKVDPNKQPPSPPAPEMEFKDDEDE